MAMPLHSTAIEQALQRLGEIVDWHEPVEILLVGAAAGMVTGQLPATRTTLDCDVMLYEPAAAMARIELAADAVAREQGLSEGWLNSHVQIRADSLPDGWRQRRIWVGDYGSLRVYAASRSDLIAMKFLAHRPRDLKDLATMAVSGEELRFTTRFLNDAPSRGTSAKEIEEALQIVGNWKAAP